MNNFDAFFKPRGIAILGASSDPSKLGYAVTRNLIDSGYSGHIYLINAKGGTIFNYPIYTYIKKV
ncbi:MAG: CoA-binding protein, partial [Chloroflexota bacterium]